MMPPPSCLSALSWMWCFQATMLSHNCMNMGDSIKWAGRHARTMPLSMVQQHLAPSRRAAPRRALGCLQSLASCTACMQQRS